MYQNNKKSINFFDDQFIVINPNSKVSKKTQNIKNEDIDFCDPVKLVKQDPNNIKLIDHQNNDLCKMAIDQNCFSIRHVKDKFKTLELCVRAATISGFVLVSMRDQHPDVCIAGIKSEPKALKFVKILEKKLYDNLNHSITI